MTSRTVLKSFFKRGAIPTEANFADLIDSMLNQDDDNIAKPSNDPLKITANGSEETLINFYEQGAQKPSWQISQKSDGKTGLSISDATTNAPTNRLFIEAPTGNVGIGTLQPRTKFQVDGVGEPFIVNGNDYYFFVGVNREQGDYVDIGAYHTQNGWKNLVLNRGSGNVGIGTTTPQATLDVNGSIKSTMWRVTQVFNNKAGPLPLPSGALVPFGTGTNTGGVITGGVVTGGATIDTGGINAGGLHTVGPILGTWQGGFQSKGGTLLIFASGSGFRNGSGGIIGMQIQIDGSPKGFASTFTNEPGSHKAFVANALVVTGIAAGNHNVTLARLLDNATETDGNDRFCLTVLELPF